MTPSCPSPLEPDRLLAYWLGELDAAAETRAEEHLLGCAACSERLGELVALGRELRRLARQGAVRTVVNHAFVRRLVEQGVRVREYRVPHNGSVDCTVAPGDDVVIARLDAPLGDVARLDMVETDSAGNRHARLEDVPFRADSGGITVVAKMDVLRALPASVMRMHLLAVEAGGERVIGEYIFRHTPHAER